MPSLSTSDFHKLYTQLLDNEKNLKTLADGAGSLFDLASAFIPGLKPEGATKGQSGPDFQTHLDFVQKQIQLLQRVAYEKEAAVKSSPLLSKDTMQLLVQLNQFAGIAAGLLGAKEVTGWTDTIDKLLRAPVMPAKTDDAPAQPTGPSSARPQYPTTVQFIKILDGDTSLLEGERKLRYIGIDTPEMHGDDDKPEPYAIEAREFNKKLVKGQSVRVEYDAEPTDHYGRLLGYLYVGDTFVNAELLKAGLAYPLAVRPNTKHAELFSRLAQEAKAARRGLWKDHA